MKKLLIFSLCLFANLIQAAIIVNAFNPSVFNSNLSVFDSNVGITGFTVEDFDDGTLVNGLQVSFSGGSASSTTGNIANSSATAWGTSGVLVNAGNDLVTFHLTGGASSFALGMSNMEVRRNPDASILVNGVAVVTPVSGLPEYLDTVNDNSQKNIYIRLDAIGETINTVSLDWGPQAPGSPGLDGIVFDHVAFSDAVAVPEPSSLLFLGLSTLFFLRHRKK